MDREEIEKCIPHRTPFLFVDRVLELSEEKIITEWMIDPDAAFLQGHYPGNPVVPGVLLNEFVFQSAAIFMSRTVTSQVHPGSIPVLTRIDDARFKHIVRPGEVVRAETGLTERVGPACYMNSKVTSGERKVMRLDFVVALTKPEVAS